MHRAILRILGPALAAGLAFSGVAHAQVGANSINPSAAASDIGSSSAITPGAAASDLRNPNAINPSSAASDLRNRTPAATSPNVRGPAAATRTIRGPVRAARPTRAERSRAARRGRVTPAPRRSAGGAEQRARAITNSVCRGC